MEQRSMRRYRLLCVEDHASAREALRKIIANKYPNLILIVADNGASGLAAFRKKRQDIVLADLNMPVMDGLQMAREIKALDAETTIIAVSAHNNSLYLYDAIEIGIRHYILKPVVTEKLFAVLDKTITELNLMRQAWEQERQLRNSEQQLAMAQKITRLGSWEWDIARDKTSWSDELYRILGLDPGSTPASYDGFLESVHPDDRKTLKRILRSTVRRGQPLVGYYCRVVRPDGSIRTIHCKGDFVFDTGGRVVSLIGTFHDVTEQRQLEEERNMLAMIVESSLDAIFSISQDGVVTSWNRGAETIFGYAAAEIVGNQIFTIIPSERYLERSQILEGILKGEQIRNYETTRLKKDGSNIFISLTTSPIYGADGTIVGNSVVARDVTERRQMEEIIKHQAHYDKLTNLPNRQLFMDFLMLELAQSQRNNKKLALLFLDLNGFKRVNDTLGHSCGDRLLQQVAGRLKDSIRVSDTVARLGGDEFTVLMPDLSRLDDVGTVLQKILAVFEKPFMLDNVPVETSTSIGVCMFPDDGDSGEDLMKKADIAMYDAKSSGRNSYQFYNAEINARTVARQKIEGFLRKAVGNGELQLLFQPLVCNDTRRIIGAEALLRWRHPEQGLLSPSQFLLIAEESGAIVPIGEWVIRNACSQTRLWNESGYPLNVSVNISNRQFHQADFIEKTSLILEETGLLPSRLEFDVAEKTIMDDVNFSLSTIQALTEIGVTFAIDNFGCGSSSLQSIKKMHTHRIKIDRSFVMNMLADSDDLAFVNTVIAMSHNLNMEVVSNGVETEAQLSVIRESGCDQLQGNVISEPLIPAQFEQFVVNF